MCVWREMHGGATLHAALTATRRAKDAQASLEAANAALAAKDAALGVMEARAAAVVAELERLRVSEADALEAAAAEQVNHQISFVETRQEIVQNPDKKRNTPAIT